MIKKGAFSHRGHKAAKPQPKNLYWTQMNTDKHRFYWQKNQREKTEWDTDEHGSTRIKIHEKILTND
jgi:hypothetical protein